MALKDNSVTETDVSLLERMGDSRLRTEAWSIFVARYTRLFVVWFRHWGVDPHTMEDLLQETLMRVLNNIKQFDRRNQGSFRAWLKTLARNSWNQLIIDAERQLAQRGADPRRVSQLLMLRTESAENHLYSLLDELATKELLSLAHSRVRRRVDQQTWETYQRVLIEETPVKNVVAALQIPASQVYSNLFRVRRMLREELEKLENPA